MTRRGYEFKPYVTYTVHYSYYNPFKSKWINSTSVSYRQTTDEAIAETHDTIIVSDYEGFHVTEIEETVWTKEKT